MKRTLLIYVFCGAFAAFAGAATVTTGTPNSYGAGLSPTFGTLINFDNLTPASTLSSSVYASKGVTSITNQGTAPLEVLPLSQQTPPNEISTGASDNYAGDILITFSTLANKVGIGVAEDGITPVTLTIWGASNNVLGTFTETVPATAFNAYYVISDPSYDIHGFEISAAQNLAIDDLQFNAAPEPAAWSLLVGGGALLTFFAFRRKQKTTANF